MQDAFDLPVQYRGEEILFPAKLLQLGYTHRFQVEVFGQEVLFEPDEDRNYRALINYDDLKDYKNIDVDLLSAIAKGIESVI